MLLHSLTLNNVGVYRGPQIVIFSTDETRPITLIGGKNGAGKTSLLDSIPLVLYGSRARRILNGFSYPEHLNNLVHHGERAASIVLKFDRTEEGQQVRYVVERTWNRTSRGKSTDRLSVSTNDDARPDLVAAWPEFVEGIVPMAVADLTIFDGEKIESLADPASSAEVLRTSLYGLLGLDLVDRLRADLQSYRRRTAKALGEQQTTDIAEKLAEAEAQLAEARMEVDSASQALADAVSARVDLETQLQKANEKLARAGGGLLAERDDLHRRLAEANASADAVERELVQLASSDLPLTLVPDLLKLVASAGEQCEASRLAHQIHTAMAMRVDRLAEQLITSLGLNSSEAELVHDVLRTDLEPIERPPLPSFSPSLECANAAREILNRGSRDLQATAQRLAHLLNDHNTNVERLERTLAAVPDADRIAPTVQLVATAEAELRTAQGSVERALLMVGEAERRALQAQRDVDALAHRALEAGAADKNASRIAREITAADEVLAEFADHMIRKHLGRITKEIDAALATLLRKQGLVAGVLIDPSDLSVTLLDHQRKPFSAHRMSAGERQMMATAVLWGLSQCTGMALPTVIDTPVARLDQSHRTNLVERYFPNASRQVVLLSTDEEIVGDHLQRLLPHVGVQYCLDFDETEACSSITMGYFDD